MVKQKTYDKLFSMHVALKTEKEELETDVKALLNQIKKVRRKLAREKLWLSAGYDPYKDPTDEGQQGPLVTELFRIVDALQEKLK